MVISEDSLLQNRRVFGHLRGLLSKWAVYALTQERSGRNWRFMVTPRTTVKGVSAVYSHAEDIGASWGSLTSCPKDSERNKMV